MENFVEYSLPYKLTAKDQLMRIVLTLAPMVAGVLAIMYIWLIGILLCAGCCFLSYRIFLSYFYELEYTLLENEIRFSKIINKERRKELLVGDISKTVSYGPIAHLPQGSRNVRSFLSHQGELPEYYWITRDAKGAEVCILFQPDDAVLEVFKVRARGKEQ